MTIAILGGTGFIGTQTIKRLLAHGEDVLVIHRGNNVPDSPASGVSCRLADRADSIALTSLLREHGVSTVIDIIALTLGNTAAVREAVAAIGGRYVMLSGADVYANYGGMIGRDAVEPRQTPATEDSPLRQSRFPMRGSTRLPKGIDPEIFENYDKLVIEEAALADPRFATTVLRPGMTFGPGDKQHRLGWAVAAVGQGGVVKVDARALAWQSSYGFVTDVADAIALAAISPKAVGRIYNIAQPKARSVGDWLKTVAGAVGTTISIEAVPPAARGVMAERADATDLRFPLTIDSGRIRAELDFVEVVSEAEAILQTIAYETDKR